MKASVWLRQGRSVGRHRCRSGIAECCSDHRDSERSRDSYATSFTTLVDADRFDSCGCDQRKSRTLGGQNRSRGRKHVDSGRRLHHRSDALTSVAAFLGITIGLVGGPGYEPRMIGRLWELASSLRTAASDCCRWPSGIYLTLRPKAF